MYLKFYVFMFQVPPTWRFVMDGEMPDYLLAKDLFLLFESEQIIFVSRLLQMGNNHNHETSSL